jgi:pimeloyl-ACP methyl ester carboxylesterase
MAEERNAAGAPLVLLHAIGLAADQWDGCSGLPPAVAVDLPGHGDRPLHGDADLGGAADTVAAVIPPGCDVVGLSLGGMVAQHLALRHPGHVRSLVLICTRPASDATLMRRRATLTRQRGMTGMLESTLHRWFTAEALAEPDHPGVAYARRRLLADDPAVIASYWRAMADHDLRRDLGRIDVPVTIVVGRRDPAYSAESAEAFQRLITGSRVEECDGPHLLCLERPGETVMAIRSHLRRLAGTGA